MKTPADSETTLGLIAGLLDALDAAGISYCHWKSNEAIDRSLNGDNDLDLLIARRDGPRFNAVLAALEFRLARPSPDRQMPGLIDFFGRDDASGRLVHVQAHYQLIVGDDMTKNFRLAIEEAYLASRSCDGRIAVPSADFELLVFILRMVIKHGPWDAQISRKGRLTASERRERDHLLRLSDPASVEELRERHLPFVSVELLAECLRSTVADSGHVRRAIAAHRLLRVLEPIGRYSRGTDLRLRLWRRWRRRTQDGRPASRRSLDSGGLLIGVVGGDGSGKSSTVAALSTTFSRYFPTHTVHMGKPRHARSGRLLKKTIRRLSRASGESPSALPAWADFGSLGFPGHAFFVWHMLTARYRHQEYQLARRAAASGALVICDRFPLEEITLMDSPRGHLVPGLQRRPIARWLAAREAAYYNGIGHPDLLIVLRVDPEVAVGRRGEDGAEFVARRAEEVWSHDWSSYPAVVIDSSRPQPVVLAEAHAAVWRAL